MNNQNVFYFFKEKLPDYNRRILVAVLDNEDTVSNEFDPFTNFPVDRFICVFKKMQTSTDNKKINYAVEIEAIGKSRRRWDVFYLKETLAKWQYLD